MSLETYSVSVVFIKMDILSFPRVFCEFSLSFHLKSELISPVKIHHFVMEAQFLHLLLEISQFAQEHIVVVEVDGNGDVGVDQLYKLDALLFSISPLTPSLTPLSPLSHPSLTPLSPLSLPSLSPLSLPSLPSLSPLLSPPPTYLFGIHCYHEEGHVRPRDRCA